MTREKGYEDHISELDLVTTSSNPELAFDSPIADTSTLYNTFIGDYTNVDMLPRQMFSQEL